MHALVRIAGEVNTKSNTVRRHFAKRLMQNMRAALGEGCTVTAGRSWGRLHVTAPDRAALEPLSQVFGIASYSPVIDRTELNLEAMIAKARELYSDRVKGKSFAVRCRRGNVAGFKSIEIERAVGAALIADARKVDLSNPEVTVHIDVRQEGAFFFDETIPGPEGLPIGVQGKAICLMSGGFDSPVAAWYIMKRGVEVDFLFLNLGGAAYERSVMAISRALADGWAHGYRPRLMVVKGEKLVDAISSSTKDSYKQLILKRVMYRLASKSAERYGAQAIITGEALGQVSSQTLFNLAAISTAASVPVLRPLIGFEKNEIIALSRKIGTFNLSEHVQEYCNLVPNKPVTRASVDAVDIQDQGVSDDLIELSLEEAETYQVLKLDFDKLMTEYLFVDQIPSNAQIIDCRPARHYDHWHFPGSKNFPIEDLLAQYKHWDRTDTYVLYCPFGLQSAVAAEKMQNAGYNAYSFKGGLRSLRALAKHL